MGPQVVGLLNFIRPGVVTGKFGKVLFCFGFAVRLEIDLTQAEQSGGLGVLAWILGADLGGELLTDSFKDGARLLSLACCKEGVGEALEISPVQRDLGGEGLLIGLLIETKCEGGLACLKRNAGLGEKNLRHKSGLSTGLTG